MRLGVRLRLTAVLLCLFGTVSGAKAQLKFAYTGGLYGYFRDDVAPPESKLIASLNSHGYALRLAMGGNYSPEFGAALQLPEVRSALNPEESYPECHLDPISLSGSLQVRNFYKDDGHAAPRAQCDNVTRFFMKAGYRVILPSQQDFLYGSGWLRSTAIAMREPSSARYIANAEHRMNMLAANLRIGLNLQPANGNARRICPLLFASAEDWQRARPCDAASDAADEEPADGIGYVQTSLGGNRTWIIGVAGKEVLDGVSRSKRTVCMNVRETTSSAENAEVVSCAVKHTTEATLFLSDPVSAVLRMLRKAKASGMAPSDHIVVMAQMSPQEANALALRLRRRLEAMAEGSAYPAITAILTRSDGEQYTPTVQQSFNGHLDRAIVLTPRLAYETDFNTKTPDRLIEPESYAEFFPPGADSPSYRITHLSPGGLLGLGSGATALSLLYTEIHKHTVHKVQTCDDPQKVDACSLEMTQFLLKTLLRAGRAESDAALLEHGDFFMGMLPEGFAGYEMCSQMKLPEDRCRLWVALDRVIWRADFMERVAVSGDALIRALARSEDFSKEASDAVGASISDEWLESFGIMRASVRTQPEPTQSNGIFSPPENLACAGSDTEAGPAFCINGKTIDPSRAYWIVSSDDLADDSVVYTEFGGTPERLRHRTDTRLSQALVDAILPVSSAAPAMGLEAVATPGDAISNAAQMQQQLRKHLRLDFGKAIVGFMQAGSTHPGGDNYSARFQGVGDTRASQASQRVNDFELQMRSSVQLGHAFFHRTTLIEAGTDTIVEYARMATGKLDGTPATPSYAKNTLSVSPFIQFVDPVHQPGGGLAFLRPFMGLGIMRLASRGGTFSVSLDRQLIAPPLFFTYQTSDGFNAVNAVRIDKNWGVKPRAGIRFESAEPHHWFQTTRSSFIELGVQYSRTFHLLRSLQLQNPGSAPSLTCSSDSSSDPARGKISIIDCLKNTGYAIGPLTTGNATYGNVGVPGLYWKMHLRQAVLGDRLAFVTDSDAEANVNAGRDRALSTQTRYAIPLSLALETKSLGNLVFAPSIDFFFYSNQIDHATQLYRSIKISVRWYFDRDSRVPFRKQVRIPGPSGSDATATRAMP